MTLAILTAFTLASLTATAQAPKKAPAAKQQKTPAQNAPAQQKAAPAGPSDDEIDADAEGLECDRPQSSTLAQNACAAKNEKDARKAMAAALATVMKVPKKAAAVKPPQPQFEKAAHARCDKEGAKVKGGSMYIGVVASCRAEQWKKRTAELNKLAAAK